jgi:hypothetical protein
MIRLEKRGVLTPVKLTAGPYGRTFHDIDEVEALASRKEGASDEQRSHGKTGCHFVCDVLQVIDELKRSSPETDEPTDRESRCIAKLRPKTRGRRGGWQHTCEDSGRVIGRSLAVEIARRSGNRQGRASQTAVNLPKLVGTFRKAVLTRGTRNISAITDRLFVKREG